MFIITMPIGTHAVRIHLPVGQTGQLVVDDTKNNIAINGRGTISWNGRTVDRATLRSLLAQAHAKVIEPQLLFDPAAEARYEIVNTVLADIKRSGARKLAFVSTERFSRF
jgi:biopolymer transport protein ExbD